MRQEEESWGGGNSDGGEERVAEESEGEIHVKETRQEEGG